MTIETNSREPALYMRARDAAAMLQITPRTFYDMLRRKGGPPVCRFGRGRILRIHREHFMKWLDNIQQKGNT